MNCHYPTSYFHDLWCSRYFFVRAPAFKCMRKKMLRKSVGCRQPSFLLPILFIVISTGKQNIQIFRLRRPCGSIYRLHMLHLVVSSLVLKVINYCTCIIITFYIFLTLKNPGYLVSCTFDNGLLTSQRLK